MMKVMIIGAGKLGYRLTEAMINSGIDVTVMDSNAKVIEKVNSNLDVLTVTANGLEIAILKELNIESYDLLIGATSSDESNTIMCSLAKKLGCKRTIARIRNPEYTKQMDFIKEEMGIDYIVNPDMETSNEIARYLLKNYNFHCGDFAKGKVQMIDFNINNTKSLIGRKIMDIDEMEEILIVAILRNGKIIIPDGSTILLEDDMLYVLGKTSKINEVANELKFNMERKSIKKVMILGGGNIGYYLAKKLLSFNISITIIEQSFARCKYLTEKLENVLTIHGDGTDLELLEEEGIMEMDAFICATGYDEQNILMTLVAKQMGIRKVVAKISKPNYSHLIDKLGVEVALNPINIASSDILKYIRGGKVISVSLLLGGQAEVTEILIKDLNVVGKKLKELNLPKGIIIGAIVSGGEVSIPNGESLVKEDDRLIIFCLAENMPELDIFLKSRKGGILNELWNGNKGIRKFISP